MDRIKNEKEKEMLWHFTGLLLESNVTATYIETGDADKGNKKEFVHSVYYSEDNCQKININYYFENDAELNNHFLVCERNIIPNVKTFNGELDVSIILEIMEAYNYLASDGTFVLEDGVIKYRSVVTISDETPNKIIYYQMEKMISNEIAISEKIGKVITDVSKKLEAA